MLFRHEPGTLSPTDSALPGAGGFAVERPPPGLARGKYPASPWTIGALGVALVLGTILYFVLRFRRPRP
jgi:hypothetical protein